MLCLFMNFSIHIQKNIADDLDHFSKKNGISRNKVITMAIQEFLQRQQQWSDDVINFNGLDDFPDLSRDDIKSPNDASMFS